jgi:hypothetical protein
MQTLFDPVVNEVIRLVKEQVDRAHQEKCRTIDVSSELLRGTL